MRDLLALMRKAEARKLEKNVVRKAQQATSMGALKKLTRSVDGERRITDAPPLVEHIPMRQDPTLVLRRYLRSLPADRRVSLQVPRRRLGAKGGRRRERWD